MDRFVNKKIEKQTIYEIYRACRLCGAGGGYKMPIIQNVVNLDNCDVELKQKIRECVQIEVHQGDKMPPLICELCVDKVNDFYEFLEMCRLTNKRTRLKLGLPPQMLPRGAPDAGDCILGVTEPIFVNDEDSNEPLADKKNKGKTGKLKRENEKKWLDVKVKLEPPPRESRAGRARAPSTALGRLQSKVKKCQSPPPKSILKKSSNNKPEVGLQPPSTRLKRSRESEAKADVPAKRVKISLKSPPRPKQSEAKKRRAKQREAEKRRGKELRPACEVCGGVFKTLQALLSHRKVHVVTHTNPKLACNPCEKWFPSAEEAEAHHKRHRRQALRYRCRRCGVSAATLQAYDAHVEDDRCVPWEEVPDIKCDSCWRMFPTRTLLDGHRCQGPRGRPGGQCTKCGKNYASRKSLANHVRHCRKGEVTIPPELRARLKPVQVRVARCDPLLANVLDGHYDVSSVPAIYGLDKTSVYPYISSGVRIKSEPSDCMVKINDMGFHVHWDSDDCCGDSDNEHLDSIGLGAFRKRKVESLAACSLKSIFSGRFLGKVPRRFRRIKAESSIDSALNDSLSDLNLNGDEVSTSHKDVNDTVNNSDKKIDESGDDDLFPEVNSVEKVTNDDFDSLFGDDKTDGGAGDGGDEIAASGDRLDLKNSEESETVKGFHDLASGVDDDLDKDSICNGESVVKQTRLDSNISSSEDRSVSSEQRVSRTDEGVINDRNTKLTEANIDLNDIEKLNQVNSTDVQDDIESELLRNSDAEIEMENKTLKNERLTDNDESTSIVIKSDFKKETVDSERDKILNTPSEDKENRNNGAESTEREHTVDSRDVKGNSDSKTQVNGDADIEDMELNMNDLKDFSEGEYDDCQLMAEIDAQIGEKEKEAPDNAAEKPPNDERALSKDESQTEVIKEANSESERTQIEKVNNTERREGKITLEDLLPKEDHKSMDLDSISDDEFYFND